MKQVLQIELYQLCYLVERTYYSIPSFLFFFRDSFPAPLFSRELEILPWPESSRRSQLRFFQIFFQVPLLDLSPGSISCFWCGSRFTTYVVR